MSILSQEKIKQIAEELDCGFCVYVHKQTHELITLPDMNQHSMMEEELWEEERKPIDENPNDYFEIEPWDSRQGFKAMADFAENLEDNEDLKNQLIKALSRRGPFRAFKDEIDDAGPYRQQWFDYKAQRLQEYVQQQLEYMTQQDEED